METSKTLENPYLAARREWNERYGDFVKAASTWRLIALIAMSVALVATLGAIYIGAQSKLVPYVIGVDELGRISSVGIPDQKGVDEKVLRATLADWITWHRSVVSDPSVQEMYVLKTYAYLTQASSAKGSLDEWYKSEINNPYERMKNISVTVEVQSVLLLSGKTYQIDWKETQRNKGGQVILQENFRSLITIEMLGVDPTLLLKNPLGVYVKTLSIQQI
ncbi:MAG: VirB8/TrbF family protein [Proteobacteria bacterium]|nr:VirB8/TrbF family protein [Pseudomonadota bacterium]